MPSRHRILYSLTAFRLISSSVSILVWGSVSCAYAADVTPSLPTLAQALAQAEAPKQDLYLAVGADKVLPAKGGVPPAPGDSASRIAAAYGRNIGGFGNVNAITAPVITVVNIPPDKPDPYDGMEPKQLLRLLTQSFKADQWKAFMSESGVGYSDMNSAQQRTLFEALFPGGTLKARRPDDETRTEISGEQLRQAHLRLTYVSNMGLAVAGKPNEHVFTGANAPHIGPSPFEMENSRSDNADHEFGADVLTVAPAALKSSDLSDDNALHAMVSVSGLKTVEDVIRAVAAATQREIYADPRYAARSVTVLGADHPARALDLLKALALCVGGTYRKVGPALTLTDDLVGLAVKHELWRKFEEQALKAAPQGSTGAAPKPSNDLPYTALDIPWSGSDLPATQKQKDNYWSAWRKKPQLWQNGVMQLDLPYNELSPVQQNAARKIKEQNDRWGDKTTLDTDVSMGAYATVQIILPGIDAPVSIPNSYDRLLPDPPLSNDEKAAIEKLENFEAPTQASRQTQTPRSLKPLLATFKRRAALVEASSPEDVTKMIARMTSLGLNELWLKIIPGENDVKSDDAAIALLQRAVDQGKTAHIAVYPALSLFAWSALTPDDLQDRTLMGAPGVLEQHGGAERLAAVTPFHSEVGRRLFSLVGKAARVPGVAGMVWDETHNPGYVRLGEHEGGMQNGEALGYCVAGRLAYLRKRHVDPIDLYDNYYTRIRAGVIPPDFGEQALDSSLVQGWRTLRMQTADGLIRWLTTALSESFSAGVQRTPLLLPPANEDASQIYMSWDNFALPSPTLDFIFPKDAKGQIIPEGQGTAHMEAALVCRRLPVYSWPNASAAILNAQIARDLQSISQTGEKNIVLTAATSANVLDTLTNAEAAAKTNGATP